MYQCDATIGQEAAEFGFRPVRCTQTVGTKGYWAATEAWENTDHFVAFCAIDGHEANVRRRFPERQDIPQPKWLHEDPAFADDIDAAKWDADRRESWTAS